MLSRGQITEDNVKQLALPLLQAQARYTAELIVDETSRWGFHEDVAGPDFFFVSDDGTDDVKGACGLVQSLTHIVYEGTAQDLVTFLWGEDESETSPALPDLVQTCAADAPCAELAAYIKD